MLIFQAFWRLTPGARQGFALAIAAMVLASCLLYIPPLIAQAVLDVVLLDREPTGLSAFTLRTLGGTEFVRERLWLPALAMFGITALAGVGTYLRQRWSAAACESVIRRLRDRVYDHLQRLPSPWFDEAETGDVVQRCTSDVDTIQVFLATHVVEIARSLVMFVVPLPFMIAISGRMTVVSVLMIPVITAFSTLFFLKVRKAFTEKDEAEAAMTTVVQENLTGIRVVRAFGRGAFEEERFSARNIAHRDLDARLYRLMANFWSLSDLLTFCQMVLVLTAGSWLMSTGELGPGAFFYFLTATTMFMYPLRQVGRIVADLGKATVSFSRLHEILDTTEEDALGEAPIQAGAITFTDVHFSYEGGAEALQGLSLHIPARTTAAIVGASGSGKTTLVSLLLRLYDPTSGSIAIDGVPLEQMGRRALRSKLAVVMQEPFLFSKSIGANLALGRSDATSTEIEAATDAADVHDTILRFDAGYDTEIGERGVTLSGGQRQRVALARALLQNPSVLLLDDSLSAVDTHTEAAILERLEARRGRQTTVIIAHRLSTVFTADQIFVLDEGRVVECGDHQSLLARNGPYARLWALQSPGISHAV